MYRSLRGKVFEPKSIAVLAPGNKLVLMATLARLDKAWLAYAPPLEGANPQLVDACKQIVPVASGMVMTLRPPVDVPVIWNRLVAGVADEPDR